MLVEFVLNICVCVDLLLNVSKYALLLPMVSHLENPESFVRPDHLISRKHRPRF